MHEKPHYAHNCEACVFLGGCVYHEDYYDLYWCLQLGKFPTVIARWSDEGRDYLSGIPGERTRSLMPDWAMTIAYERAKERGLQLEMTK